MCARLIASLSRFATRCRTWTLLASGQENLWFRLSLKLPCFLQAQPTGADPPHTHWRPQGRWSDDTWWKSWEAQKVCPKSPGEEHIEYTLKNMFRIFHLGGKNLLTDCKRWFELLLHHPQRRVWHIVGWVHLEGEGTSIYVSNEKQFKVISRNVIDLNWPEGMLAWW